MSARVEILHPFCLGLMIATTAAALANCKAVALTERFAALVPFQRH